MTKTGRSGRSVFPGECAESAFAEKTVFRNFGSLHPPRLIFSGDSVAILKPRPHRHDESHRQKYVHLH